jgi:hypothetical protein
MHARKGAKATNRELCIFRGGAKGDCTILHRAFHRSFTRKDLLGKSATVVVGSVVVPGSANEAFCVPRFPHFQRKAAKSPRTPPQGIVGCWCSGDAARHQLEQVPLKPGRLNAKVLATETPCLPSRTLCSFWDPRFDADAAPRELRLRSRRRSVAETGAGDVFAVAAL